MPRAERGRWHNRVAAGERCFYNRYTMRWEWGAAVGFLSCCLAGTAGAEELPVHRGGFTVGFSAGVLVGNARGYPNEGEKIGVPEFETITGVGASGGGAIWLGSAMADWLNVHLGFASGSWRTRGRQASVWAFQFRVETFPLYALGGAWRDVGLLGTTGLGAISIVNGDESLVDGGGTSAVGVGVFYEPVHFLGLAMGPQLEYAAQFSENATGYSVVLGWRTAFYADP